MSTVTTPAVAALVPTALLIAVHLYADRIRRAFAIPEEAVVSAAGGISVSYIFLHLLPEVAAGREPLGARLEDLTRPTPLHELAVFVVALLGFTVFYGLERLAARSGSPRDRGGDQEPQAAAFGAHVAAFAVYNMAIAYTLGTRIDSDVIGAALFTVAIGVHILVVDRGMAEHYPRRFRRWGRFVLCGALAVGWAVALVLPTSATVVGVLMAGVAGTVLLTVLKEELPTARASRFGWFLGGLVVYSVLLIGLILLAPDAVSMH